MENMEMKEIESAIEGILFASGEPVQIDRICLALDMDRPTVEQVLHQPGQFTAIHNYYDQERPVSAQVRSAVADALQIPDVTGGALYFYNPGYMQDGPVLDWFESLETTLVFEEVWYCK